MHIQIEGRDRQRAMYPRKRSSYVSYIVVHLCLCNTLHVQLFVPDYTELLQQEKSKVSGLDDLLNLF